MQNKMNSSEELAIDVHNVSKEFILDNGESIKVLKDISLTASFGEFVSIIGVSGSGKSTLLKCMASLLQPSNGSVYINGINPYSISDSKLAKLRREQIGFIFQSYNLIPALPVSENIAINLRLSHKKVDFQQIDKLLSKLHFKADSGAFINSLSGGEQQKVAIARVLVSNSDIIFADEPTGALDSVSREDIFNILKSLCKMGKCIVMVTHDIEMASNTDRALVLRDGKIIQELIHPTEERLYEALRKKEN